MRQTETESTALEAAALAALAEPPHGQTLSPAAWVQIGVLTALFVCSFYDASLRRLWLKTNPFFGEPNWSHAICVPIVGLYYLYARRREVLETPVKVCWTGVPILVAGLLIFGYGIWPGQNDFLKDVGMVVTLFGLVSFLLGWQMMRIAWFPIAFLVCAIPWPGLVYSWIASPLQQLAAKALQPHPRKPWPDASSLGQGDA
jgi:hypothetical protein